MTLAVATDPPGPPPIGSIIYLASYLLKVALKAETTPPDTPNQYGADIEVQGDQGDMDLDPLRGPRGFPGKAQFPLRRQSPPPVVNNEDDLPDDLTDTLTDIGKYWEIDTIVDGVITKRESHVWYGTEFRIFQMGTRGVPGALPDINLNIELLPPQLEATYPDTTSYAATSGGRLSPSWRFKLAVPYGVPGDSLPIAELPDVDLLAPGVPASGDLFAYTGRVDVHGRAIWGPMSPSHFSTQFFSIPQSAFTAYTGYDQRAAIGSFTLPAMPFRYTPIVWGHLGAGGLHLSADPLTVGSEVWLGDPDEGTLVARGFGNFLGEVNIMPHYSTPTAPSRNVSVINHVALVAAGDEATLNISLWNQGQLGIYAFSPTGAQVMVLLQPVERDVVIPPFDA